MAVTKRLAVALTGEAEHHLYLLRGLLRELSPAGAELNTSALVRAALGMAVESATRQLAAKREADWKAKGSGATLFEIAGPADPPFPGGASE